MAYQVGENVERITRDVSGRLLNAETGRELYSPTASGSDIMFRTGNTNNVIRYVDVMAAIKTNGNVLRYANQYPGPTNVHVEKALSDFAVGYEIDSGLFVAPEISKVLTVTNRTDQYFVLARGDVLRQYGTKLKRGIGAVANDGQQGFSLAQYAAIDYAFRDFLPDKIVANADEALQLTQQTTRFLTDVMDFGWDQRVITQIEAITQTATFADLVPGVSGPTIGTSTISTPYISTAINAAIGQAQLQNNGYTPNTIVMNATTARKLSISPLILDQTVYSPGGEAMIKVGGLTSPINRLSGLPDSYLGLKVVVVNIPINTAAVGADDVFGTLLDGSIALLYTEEPSRRTRNFSTTFRVGGINVRTYRDEPRRGTFIEVEMDQVEAVTNPHGAFLITAVS